MKNTLISVTVERLDDNDPDLSWLDQFEDSSDKDEQEYYTRDQERKASYGDQWYMVGVRAKATIGIPQGQGITKLQEITSGGIWGIESDSNKEYFTEVGKEELAHLKEDLIKLNVNIKGFNSLITSSI